MDYILGAQEMMQAITDYAGKKFKIPDGTPAHVVLTYDKIFEARVSFSAPTAPSAPPAEPAPPSPPRR